MPRCCRSNTRCRAPRWKSGRSGPRICAPHSPKRAATRICLLNATPCSILVSSILMIDSAVVRLLIFRVGTLSCAAEVETVREILPRLTVTRIPGAPPEVAGMVNVRGALVTVVDGWRALGQDGPDAPEPGSGTTVLLEVDGGRRDRKSVV